MSFDFKIITIQSDNGMYLIQCNNCASTSNNTSSCNGNSNAVFTSVAYTGQSNYQWYIVPYSTINPTANGASSNTSVFLVNQANLLALGICPSSGICPSAISGSTSSYITLCVDSIVNTKTLPTATWNIMSLTNGKYAIRNVSTIDYLSRCSGCINSPCNMIDQPVVDSTTTANDTTAQFTITTISQLVSLTIIPPSTSPSPSPSPSPSVIPSIEKPLNAGAITGIVITGVVILLLIAILIWLSVKYYQSRKQQFL